MKLMGGQSVAGAAMTSGVESGKDVSVTKQSRCSANRDSCSTHRDSWLTMMMSSTMVLTLFLCMSSCSTV